MFRTLSFNHRLGISLLVLVCSGFLLSFHGDDNYGLQLPSGKGFREA